MEGGSVNGANVCENDKGGCTKELRSNKAQVPSLVYDPVGANAEDGLKHERVRAVADLVSDEVLAVARESFGRHRLEGWGGLA